MRTLPVLLLSVLSTTAAAQSAALEIKGVFGECIPVYAANSDRLVLHKSPDLNSAQVEIQYQVGWRIPAPKVEGLTRVLRVGTLRVTEPDRGMYCRVAPTDGAPELVAGEVVEYLHYAGEGFGEIRFRGAQCQAEVDPTLNHFETIQSPEVQVWLKVFFKDGSSPGWLFHDGTQTKVFDVLC